MNYKTFISCFFFLIQISAQNNLPTKLFASKFDSISTNLKMVEAQTIIHTDSLSQFASNGAIEICASKLTTVEAEQDSLFSYSNNPLPKWHSMITNIPSDWLSYFKREFNAENIPKYFGMAVLTAGLILTDEYTWRESERLYNRTQFNKNFSDFFTEFGDGRTQFGLAAAFGSYGAITNDHRAIRTASQIVEAVLAAGTVVQVLKHLTGRESPFVETIPGGEWKFFPNQIDYHKHVPSYDAYPSGHIATSLAAFIVISENYPEIKWLEPAGFVLAGLIGFGMGNKGIHWYSDYPLGIAIGYSFGKLIAHPSYLVEKENIDKKTSINIFPYFNGISKGLSFSYQF